MNGYEDLFKDIVWWQRWEIAPGVFTPGHNSVEFLLSKVDFPSDLTGKRVLDIGTWNGCFAFECERRGAEEVLAIGPESLEGTGFLRLKRFLNSRVEHRPASIYYLRPELIGRFDIVLCFGVFYHLRHPLLGLDNLRLVCDGELFLETHFIENCVFDSQTNTPFSLGEIDKRLLRIPLLQFYQRDELLGDASNWFGPNHAAMIAMLKSSGFSALHHSSYSNRAYYRCAVDPGMPEFLTINCAENGYYETVMSDLFGPNKEIFRK